MLIDKNRGYTVQLETFSEEIIISTSVNYTELLRANSFRLSLSMDTPIQWYSPRVWSYDIYMNQSHFYLLYDHIALLTDLLADWGASSLSAMEFIYTLVNNMACSSTSDTIPKTASSHPTIIKSACVRDSSSPSHPQSPIQSSASISDAASMKAMPAQLPSKFSSYAEYEQYHFIPYDTKYKIHALDFKLYLCVNQHNVINRPNDLADNSMTTTMWSYVYMYIYYLGFFVVYASRFECSFEYLYSQPQPISSVTSFNISVSILIHSEFYHASIL
jgi:hypothetical protein